MKRILSEIIIYASLRVLVLLTAGLVNLPTANAVISWDSEAGTQWWFDPVNWATPGNPNTVLPPSGDASGSPTTDTHISMGTDTIMGGEGVVYDPSNDPFFAGAFGLPYPGSSSPVGGTYGPQHISHLYIGRNTTSNNLLTIKSGDLIVAGRFIVGRSGNSSPIGGTSKVIQTGGRLDAPLFGLDIGQHEASGWGNGTYIHEGGILEVDAGGFNGIRLSAGGSTGPGGLGKFVMHNPTSGGYVRTYRYNSSAYRGDFDPGTSILDPDGVVTGVSISEFHYENGGTRPIQISQNLQINNGFQSETGGTVSSRLDLILHEAACTGIGCVPNNIGLFDVDFDMGHGSNGGVVNGIGSLGGTFSNADGTSQYAEGSMVSAVFGSKQYNWTISYEGNITWFDAANSVVAAVEGPGTGDDVVLIGHSTIQLVPEPGSLTLVATVLLASAGRGRRNNR
jgi:hypothetical protein